MIEYLDMIRKITWSYVKSNPGMDFDDMFSEACLACLEAEDLYNPLKGKKTTYLWQITVNTLNSLILDKGRKDKAESYHDMTVLENTLTDHYPSPEQSIIAEENWNELFQDLSPEAREICRMVLDDEEILFFPGVKPKFCRGQISRVLRENRKWSWPKIWRTFREMKHAFSG